MLLQLILLAEENTPEAEDVVAGWTGLLVILGMAVAVAFLGWSLVRQLKKADKAEQEGLYDEREDSSADSSDPSDDSK